MKLTVESMMRYDGVEREVIRIVASGHVAAMESIAVARDLKTGVVVRWKILGFWFDGMNTWARMRRVFDH